MWNGGSVWLDISKIFGGLNKKEKVEEQKIYNTYKYSKLDQANLKASFSNWQEERQRKIKSFIEQNEKLFAELYKNRTNDEFDFEVVMAQLNFKGFTNCLPDYNKKRGYQLNSKDVERLKELIQFVNLFEDTEEIWKQRAAFLLVAGGGGITAFLLNDFSENAKFYQKDWFDALIEKEGEVTIVEPAILMANWTKNQNNLLVFNGKFAVKKINFQGKAYIADAKYLKEIELEEKAKEKLNIVTIQMFIEVRIEEDNLIPTIQDIIHQYHTRQLDLKYGFEEVVEDFSVGLGIEKEKSHTDLIAKKEEIKKTVAVAAKQPVKPHSGENLSTNTFSIVNKLTSLVQTKEKLTQKIFNDWENDTGYEKSEKEDMLNNIEGKYGNLVLSNSDNSKDLIVWNNCYANSKASIEDSLGEHFSKWVGNYQYCDESLGNLYHSTELQQQSKLIKLIRPDKENFFCGIRLVQVQTEIITLTMFMSLLNKKAKNDIILWKKLFMLFSFGEQYFQLFFIKNFINKTKFKGGDFTLENFGEEKTLCKVDDNSITFQLSFSAKSLKKSDDNSVYYNRGGKLIEKDKKIDVKAQVPIITINAIVEIDNNLKISLSEINELCYCSEIERISPTEAEVALSTLMKGSFT